MSECLDDELLLGFVERRLDLETTARVEDHIDACAACRRLLAMLAPTEAPSSGSEHASEGEDSVVEGYAMEEVIGEGAMGRVFAARDRQTGERVAVKVMRADARELVERFAREAAFMAQVSHPNVVGIRRVVEVGTGGTLALVMDLLEGRTLEDQLQEAPALSVAEAGRIGICLARAAGAAHAHGIIHRDIKPANVFLETASDGPARVRLLDFGLAKLFRVHPDGVHPRPIDGERCGARNARLHGARAGARRQRYRSACGRVGGGGSDLSAARRSGAGRRSRLRRHIPSRGRADRARGEPAPGDAAGDLPRDRPRPRGRPGSAPRRWQRAGQRAVRCSSHDVDRQVVDRHAVDRFGKLDPRRLRAVRAGVPGLRREQEVDVDRSSWPAMHAHGERPDGGVANPGGAQTPRRLAERRDDPGVITRRPPPRETPGRGAR